MSTKTVNVTDLSGPALDWAVAKCEGFDYLLTRAELGLYRPSSDWSLAGPIIERGRISLDWAFRMEWEARLYVADEEPWAFSGPTPLVAAMRCYVASRLGDTVEIPEGLL